jgi:hypothetical protein
MTLPEPNYTQACRIFCRILHRLEERDRRIAAMGASTTEAVEEDSSIQKALNAEVISPIVSSTGAEKHD